MRVPQWMLFMSLVQAKPLAEISPGYFVLEDKIIVGEWGRMHEALEPRSGSGEGETTTDGNSDDGNDTTDPSSTTQLGLHVLMSVLFCLTISL